MSLGPVLYCGDPHARFRQIIEAAGHTKASAVVLLGDMEPVRPLQDEMEPLTKRGVAWFFIGGNHDGDTNLLAGRVWNETTAPHNVHCRVVTLPSGLRLAGLSGVFREVVWYPSSSAARGGAPAFRSRAEHALATPVKDRWNGGPHRKHLGTIYHEEVELLTDMQTDVLISHEAPSPHPYGHPLLMTLAQAMGARVIVHGHQHDSFRADVKGVKVIGVGLRGVTAIDAAGNAKVIVPGELDHARGHRRRHGDEFGEGEA